MSKRYRVFRKEHLLNRLPEEFHVGEADTLKEAAKMALEARREYPNDPILVWDREEAKDVAWWEGLE